MAATAFLRTAELNRLATIAKMHKVCIEVEADGKTIRINPDIPPPLKTKPPIKPMELEY